MIRDITDRKRVEQMKSEFVSTVSHELRTPLTSIAGSLGLLTGGAAGKLPDKASRLIGIAHSNSERLVRLINDILDIEKMESGRMMFHCGIVELAPVIDSVVEANRAYADSFGVSLRPQAVPEGVKVNVDTDRLTQVLTNLISNAVKFSPQGEGVDILVVPGEVRHRITIRDYGPGIPDAFHGRIFEKFAQADASDSRQKGGTGLGLAIVKEIVSRLGGQISFDSEKGKGAAFHVDLPAAAREIDHRPGLLIGCGDPAAARQMCETLEKAGYACRIGANSDEVLQLSAGTRPSAVLLDLMLPEEGAISLIRDLREEPRLANVPILVMSGEGEEMGEALAVVDWLAKPVAFERLAGAVREALERKSAGRPRVLHVDDDPDMLSVVSSAFQGRAEITSVTSLKTGRAALAANGFDLVILDLGLADGSGMELLPHIRHRDGTLIPVVIFSAEDADPELASKADAILTKSRASLGRLVETVEGVIAQHQHPRATA
jgi:DNA-binding response OmpR family regulator